MANEEGAPKLHIDSDWKAEAQKERERLAEKEKKREESGPQQGELPPADFKGLVGLLASQAIMGLGVMGDQKTGRVVVDLEGSKFYIDLLGVLDEKTQGNLDEGEADELAQVLSELRGRYVQLSDLIAKQGGAAGAPPAGEPKTPNLHLRTPEGD